MKSRSASNLAEQDDHVRSRIGIGQRAGDNFSRSEFLKKKESLWGLSSVSQYLFSVVCGSGRGMNWVVMMFQELTWGGEWARVYSSTLEVPSQL